MKEKGFSDEFGSDTELFDTPDIFGTLDFEEKGLYKSQIFRIV